MGIDIYARWQGMTPEERAAQCTGFAIDCGHLGYLREAYHGDPYATRTLVPEAFGDAAHEDGVSIPATVLRDRLTDTLEVALERQKEVYGEGQNHPSTKKVLKSFEDFVALCEAKEDETGEPCRIIASY